MCCMPPVNSGARRLDELALDCSQSRLYSMEQARRQHQRDQPARVCASTCSSKSGWAPLPHSNLSALLYRKSTLLGYDQPLNCTCRQSYGMPGLRCTAMVISVRERHSKAKEGREARRDHPTYRGHLAGSTSERLSRGAPNCWCPRKYQFLSDSQGP
eukprot:UN0568